MEDIIILGAGGHAHVIADIILQTQQYNIVGFIGADKSGGYGKISVIGDDTDLPRLYQQGLKKAFVAIGDNALRKKLINCVLEIGYELINVVSPYAVLSSNVELGKGIAIMPGAIVNCGTTIGDGVVLNTNCSVDHDCRIENYVHIAPGCAIAGSVHICEGVFLGVGARVIDKIRICGWIVIGAGAVIVNDILTGKMVVGVPAKIIK